MLAYRLGLLDLTFNKREEPTKLGVLLPNDYGATDSLLFARKRLNELERLNNGDLGGANHEERQPLFQEFFFHLVGAIDKLMQAINESKHLGMTMNQVTARQIFIRLATTDPIRPLVLSLHPETQRNRNWLPMPANQYSDEWNHFRIMVFRHWVNHCGENPFALRFGALPRVSLYIDPRNHSLGGSKLPALVELETFWKLVNDKCQIILNSL